MDDIDIALLYDHFKKSGIDTEIFLSGNLYVKFLYRAFYIQQKIDAEKNKFYEYENELKNIEERSSKSKEEREQMKKIKSVLKELKDSINEMEVY